MAKKKEELVRKVEINRELSFMTYDLSNATGRVRMAIGDGDPRKEGGDLAMSRILVNMGLPEDHDREKYEVTGELAIKVKVVRKAQEE